MEMTDNRKNGNKSTVFRRTYLATIGASVASSAVAVQRGRAAEEGYGSGGYGSGGYGEPLKDTNTLTVATVGVSSVDTSSATFTGEVTALDGFDSATIYFEWGTSNNGLTNKTAGQTLSTTGQFEATVDSLDSSTDYTFRAVAESGETIDTGDTVSFTSVTKETTLDADPVITKLDGRDVSNPRNPHVDAEVEWATTIEEGKLARAELTISDKDGEIRRYEYTLSGQTTEWIEETRIKKGSGKGPYIVELTVYTGHGTSEYGETTFESR